MAKPKILASRRVRTPTGYAPCELAAFGGGASPLASLRDALAEQSALARLNASIQTRLRSVMTQAPA